MELRPYQRATVNKLLNIPAIGLFDEQRTGKTPTALTILNERGCKRILVLCPKTMAPVWKAEIEKWLNKPAIIIRGSTRSSRLNKLKKWEFAAIVTYDKFKQTKTAQGLILEVLGYRPDAVIADEAHRFKNPKSAIAEAVFQTSCIHNRIALTGTPAHGRQHEIYSILKWLYPKSYKSYWKFIYEWFETKTSYAGVQHVEIGSFKSPTHAEDFIKILNTFSSNTKRKDVMKWLPKKDYTQIKLDPTPLQVKYLTDLKNYYETEHVVTQTELDRIIRYRQICQHPGLLDLEGTSPKLDYLLDYIADYPDKPMIVFSKFTSFLKLIENELKNKKIKYGVIYGEISDTKRIDYVNDFQHGKLNLLLLQIDASKEGLTLDRAEAAIFLDKYPPPGDIAQAEDRIIATTEAKANKPHEIIEVQLAGTYDEVLFDLVAVRASIVDVINNFKAYLDKPLKGGETDV